MNRKISATLVPAMVIFLLTVSMATGETYVSGFQSGVWTQVGSPYIVIGDITVPTGYFLSIEPGVEVLFQGTHRILVDGSVINAVGTAVDSIVFKPAMGYTMWGSIHILNTPNTKSCTFEYCLFERAHGADENDRWGGSFYTQNGRITYIHCRFTKNHAYTGAAIFGHISTLSFDHCEIFNNHNDWKGGAINFNTCNVDFDYTAICHNSAVNEAGGVYAWLGDLNFTNCTICDNSASTGGGIWNYPGNTVAEVRNCIIWNNTGGNITGPGYTAVNYSDIGGGWITGVGNINSNPQFVEPVLNNYHLKANSPCIDTGDPSSLIDPDGSPADMGAYYFDHYPPFGLSVYLEPVNPPIIIPSGGGSFNYNASVTNAGATLQNFDSWIMMQLPSGVWYGPVYGPINVTLPGGATFTRLRTQIILGSSPAGLYTYCGYIGVYNSSSKWDSASFTFTKTDSSDGGSIFEKSSQGWSADKDLLSISPDPFNPETNFRFSLPQAGWVDLQVYDVSGRLVAALVEGNLEAGTHVYLWNASGLPSGVYIARLKTPAGVATERCLLVK